MKFRDFKEAWLTFGEDGPLLEFVYLITQGDTLRERLKEQIRRIQEEVRAGKEPNQMEILKIVSLAGAYDAKVKLSSLLSVVELRSPAYTLDLFEKEYLFRLNESGNYITTLHPIRAKILVEILFNDEILTSKKYYIKKCIDIIVDEDLEFFLLHVFQKQKINKEILDYLHNVQLTSWTGFNGITNSLLWLGIKEYIEKKRNAIDQAYSEFGYGWYVVLGLDISEAIQSNPINIFKDFDLPIKSEIKEEVDNWQKDLQKETISIYKFIKDYLEKSNLPAKTPENDKDWASCGESLFWFGKLDIKRNINLNDFDIEFGVQECALENMADMLSGLYYYDHNNSRQISREHRTSFIKKFKKEFKVPVIEEDEIKVKLHCIIDIDEKANNIAENNFVHEQILNNLKLMRKVYPDKNKFASQGYGHRFDLIPSDIDDTNKNIPIRNLPLPWLTKINSIFSELASFKYRPSSWNEYVDDVIKKRENAIFIFENLIKGIKEHFKKQKKVDILGEYINIEHWNEIKKELGYEIPFPKLVVDAWGFNGEGKRPNNQLPRIAINLNRYRNFKDNYSELKSALQNFMNQAFNILLMEPSLKAKNKNKKAETIERLNFIGIKSDKRSKRLCMNSIYNLLESLNSFQNEFKNIFKNFMDNTALEKLEEKEVEIYNLFLSVWNKFSLDSFKYDMDIVSTAEKELMKEKKDIENIINESLNGLSNENIKINLIDYEDDYKIILLDINDPFILEDNLISIFKILSKNIKEINDSYFKDIILKLEYSTFKIIPLIKGKVLDKKAFNIDLYRLLRKDKEGIEFLDCYPELIEDELLEKLNITKWSDTILDLNLGKKLQDELGKLYFLVSHLVQIKELEDLLIKKDDISKFKIVQDYLDENSIEFNITLQTIFDLLGTILNKFTYTDEELENDSEKRHFLNLLIEIRSLIYPIALEETDSTEKEYRAEVNLEVMEKWQNNLKEAIILGHMIYLFIGEELIVSFPH
jgi:hypothetical protein